MNCIVVDDHMLFAEAIRASLEAEGVEVVGVAVNGDQAIAMARRERPDLVLMDIGLPDQSGLAAGRTILDELPDTKILVLTALNHPKVAREAMGMGFHGFLPKDVPVADFLRSVASVARGDVVVDLPGRNGVEDRPGREPEKLLTEREHEVLSLLARGFNGQAIARELSISSNTVRTHIQSIMTKLQVHSRFEAVTLAVREGMVPVSVADRHPRRSPIVHST